MAAIDFEIDHFYAEMANIQLNLMDWEKWCSQYESFKDEYVWKTKNGDRIKVGDMSESHLENAFNMVKRNDPENGWNKIFEQEKTYRRLKNQIIQAREQLAYMEDISDMCL